MSSSDNTESISLNDALKALGVTEFTKSDGSFTIHFKNCTDTLRFGLEKTHLKTLENFTENAQVFKLNGQELDSATIGQFKAIFMTEEYQKFFEPPQRKSKEKKSEAQEYNAFKYGTGIPLAEQIKLNGKYVFLQIIDGKPVISNFLDLSKEQNMVIYPTGKTPINDFEYSSEDDIKQIIEIAKTKSLDKLYGWSKSIWQKFVMVTPEQLNLLTLDSIFTFFHDRFTTTHYTMLVARVGSGKGAALITLTYLGYRVILGSSISGASLLDLFGTLEPAQVVIAEDELNFIKDDSEKRRLYTGGYDIWGLSTRTLDGSTANRKIRWFPGFGYKIFGAENSLDANGLGGLSDRTFVINLLKGTPELYIKNLRKPRLSPKYQAALSEINYFRKTMLVYRLLHADDLFEEIETNIDGRALELTGPIIDLFYALSKDKTLLRNEILPTLSLFLQEKGDLSKDSLDNIVYSAVKELGEDEQYCSKENDKVFVAPHQDICEKVRILSDGTEIKTATFISPILDEVSEKIILKHCRDKLHGKKSSIGTGKEKRRALSFDKQIIASLGPSYETVSKIELLEDRDVDNVGTWGRKNDPPGYKGDNSTILQDVSKPEIVYELQQSKQDNVNITTSESAKNAEHFKNTSSYTSTGQIYVPPSQTTTPDVKQALGNYVVWDLEWDTSKDNIVEAASFVDSNGHAEIKFRDRDFDGNESEFLKYIMGKIISYNWSMGWHTQDNSQTSGSDVFPDLRILHDRCKANNITKRIVYLANKSLPYIIGDHKHIDLYNVFGNEIVMKGMYEGKYRTKKLTDVSKGLLGHGKYHEYTGAQFNSLPIEERIQYSLIDSQLVMELAKYRDYEALDSFYAISQVTQQDFDEICRTKISTWWSGIFDKIIDKSKLKKIEFKGKYKGATVIEPKAGFYRNVIVVDAKSLYPTVGINYNLSFETINCNCCANNPNAKISSKIPEFTDGCKYINANTDWVCIQHEGIFPSKLKVFKAQRLKEKELGNNSKQYALKILINGGYGIFGDEKYKYYDPRVAELITAAGRYTLSQMQKEANLDGFEVIYGDTDSLFLNNTVGKDINDFVQKFNEKFQIELEIKNRYDELILSENAKHYVGVENGVIDSKGFSGASDDRCEYYHIVYNQLINDIFVNRVDPIPNVKRAFGNLDSHRVEPELLVTSQVISEVPTEDKSENNQLYSVAWHTNAKQSDLVSYYKADATKVGFSWTKDPSQIYIAKYKELLWNTVYEILKLKGYSIVELAQDVGVKITKTGKAKTINKSKLEKEKKKKKKGDVLENYSIVSNNLNNTGGED